MPPSHADFDVVLRSSALDPGDLGVLRMHTVEALSSAYEIEVVVQTLGRGALAADEIDDMIAGTAFVAFGAEQAHKRHGVLRSIELLPMDDAKIVAYRLLLVPRLWYTTQTFRSRVYQDLSVPDIVKKVLEETGMADDDDFAFKLNGTYAKRAYTVQYEETDFAFISRLLEEEGIFYLFEHGEEVEKILFGDSNDVAVALDGYATIRHDVRGGRTDPEETISSIARTQQVIPGKLAVRDLDWRTPSTNLDVEVSIGEGGKGVQVYYGEHHRTASDGRRIAKIRAEEIGCRKVVYAAVCGVRGLRPGHKFELSGHTLTDLDVEYLVTSLSAAASQSRHSDGAGDGNEGYRAQIEAIRLDVPYRPPRVTPKPRIVGFVHGMIDGEQTGTAAPIDDEGCYKVVLPFDTVAEAGGKATRWIRMAQAFGGPAYGVHFPLHIGIEVMLVHLDGDPDRPVIAGVLPNPRTSSPAVKRNATQSVIRTRAAIQVEFEDDAG